MASPTAPDHSDSIARMLAVGVTIPDLACMAGISEDDLETRLTLLKPERGVQRRARVYNLRDAMGALMGEGGGMSPEEIEAAVARMKPTQLPVGLQVEFWKAQKERAAYLENNGDLWRTARVQLLVATILKAVSQAMTLLADNVDQQTALTPRQREIIEGISDSVRGECRELIQEAFDGWAPEDDREADRPDRA